jgi:hypothetical protein
MVIVGQQLRGGESQNIKVLTRQRSIREGSRLFPLRYELLVRWNAPLGPTSYPFSQAPPTYAGEDKPVGSGSSRRLGDS